MNQVATLRNFLARPLAAAACYAAVIGKLALTIVSSVADLLSQRAELRMSATMLEQFEGRGPAARAPLAGGVVAPTGSPFLEGATITVAGAALLQRITAAVTKLGGNVLSSQVDLHGNQAKTGFLSVIASCELDQPGLQRLLYDVEAGMPFLFIDQLVVQAPTNFGAAADGKLRVLLTVSGQWQGGK